MIVILVTGASGGIGSALLTELTAAGHEPVALHRDPDATAAASANGRRAVTADLADPSSLPAALDGADALFLVCGMGPLQTQYEINAVDAARAAGVARIVKLSVWRADEELTDIARLHRPVEVAIAASGLSWTFLRPNFYMQNFSRRLGDSIREHGMFAQPAIDGAISFVDTGDVARVAAHVLTTPGHDGATYALTGPEALTYADAAKVLADELGRPVRYVAQPHDTARAAMLAAGVPVFHADAQISVARAYRDGGAGTVTSTVPDLTGRPATTFVDFVRANRSLFG